MLANRPPQADDYAESDNSQVLTYYEAMQRIGCSPRGPATVSRIRSDMRLMTTSPGSGEIERLRRQPPSLRAYVTDYFGDRLLVSLGPADLDKWVVWALTYKPAGRLKHGRSRVRRRGPAATEVPAVERERRKKMKFFWPYSPRK